MRRGRRSLLGDDRGQAIWIGAVLLFGFLVVGLTIYQAAIVPRQNAEIEFDHYQRVQDDMDRLGAETITVAGRNITSSPTVSLGMEYPARSVALNPPPVSGGLEERADGSIEVTTAGGSLDVAGLCGGSASTFGIGYGPAYNEFDGQPIVYENGQVYVDGESRSDAVLDGRTVIDTSRETIDIYRLSGPLPTESQTGSLSLDLEGSGIIGKAENVDVDTVTFPSELSPDKWESDAIADGDDDINSVTDVADGVEIDIDDADTYTIRCYTIGVGGDPAPIDFDSGFRSTGASAEDTNPAGGGDLVLTSAVKNTSSNNKADLTFNNTGDTKNITKIRIPFYDADTNNAYAETVDEFGPSGTFDGNDELDIPSPLTRVDVEPSFAANTAGQTITITFQRSGGNINTKQDFFLLAVKFESGETANYFVAVEG